jgi:hypothetical protein
VCPGAVCAPRDSARSGFFSSVRLDYGAHGAQVEGLQAMVGAIEELAACTELQCNAMRFEWHAQKLRAFPHVDSPARLIREITRLGPPPRDAIPARH